MNFAILAGCMRGVPYEMMSSLLLLDEDVIGLTLLDRYSFYLLLFDGNVTGHSRCNREKKFLRWLRSRQYYRLQHKFMILT